MAQMLEAFVYSSLILYSAGAVAYFAGYHTENDRVLKAASLLAIIGSIVNLLALIIRTIIIDRLPLSTGYDFIMVITFLTILLYLLVEWKSKVKSAGGLVLVISAVLTLSVILIARKELGHVSPLMPALKSPWLTSHVFTAALSYASFALATGLAAIQIKKIRKGSNVQDTLIYRIVAIGFVMLSFSIVLGAYWAEQAWGKYWSWDPKEVWALITWIVYALYLHLHRRLSWRGEKACWIVIIGFAVVLFTFFGVNYLLSGMHSYAG